MVDVAVVVVEVGVADVVVVVVVLDTVELVDVVVVAVVVVVAEVVVVVVDVVDWQLYRARIASRWSSGRVAPSPLFPLPLPASASSSPFSSNPLVSSSEIATHTRLLQGTGSHTSIVPTAHGV